MLDFLYTKESTADGIKHSFIGTSAFRNPVPVVMHQLLKKIAVPGGDGYYPISIDIGEYIHNTGYLEIKNSTYTLYMHEPDGMIIPHGVMYRIPKGTIWGYAEATNINMQNLVNSVVQTGLDGIADEADLPEGYYGYFSVIKPLGVYTVFPTYHNAKSCFAFQFSQDHTILENTVADIRAQLPADTDFKVFTWEGSEL
jgi:hypothetical protein